MKSFTPKRLQTSTQEVCISASLVLMGQKYVIKNVWMKEIALIRIIPRTKLYT